ncbi:MAG: hypothetical protein Q9M92_11185 [Enterobacterales bacterium]|nr:hypothetical protein [Enterobacterales bacterium]
MTPYDSIVNVAQQLYPYLPVKLLARDQFLSVKNVPEIYAQTLIVIAEKDQVIVRERSEALANAFEPALLSKVVIENVDHNNIADDEAYRASIKGFLKR